MLTKEKEKKAAELFDRIKNLSDADIEKVDLFVKAAEMINVERQKKTDPDFPKASQEVGMEQKNQINVERAFKALAEIAARRFGVEVEVLSISKKKPEEPAA